MIAMVWVSLFIWYLYGYRGAFLQGALDETRAPGQFGSFFEVQEAQPGLSRPDAFGVESPAVIAYGHPEFFGAIIEANQDLRGLCVFNTVLHALLDDPEKEQVFASVDLSFIAFL